jgi:uncharacterized repeat protein (TIGR02543 family)
MKTMKRGTAVLVGIIFLMAWTACNNFFYDLIPPDDNQVTEFELKGLEGAAINNDNNTIIIPWSEGMNLIGVINSVSLPPKASLLFVTQEYIQDAFPGIENPDDLIKMIEDAAAENLTDLVTDVIKQNQDFRVPALDKPIDFSSPVTLLVISGHGSVRRYTVSVVINVTFETNGGSNIDVQGVVYGTAISRPTPAPSRTGYTFANWYRDNKTFEQTWDFNATITESVILYAKWEAITYTVHYDRNAADAEGSTSDSNHTYDKDGELTLNGYTREEYNFAGWNTAPGGNGSPYRDRHVVKNLSATDGAVITLYAQWSSIYKNTVTFESNGGSSASPVTNVNNGDTISRPAPDPVKTGYTFEGWYRDNNTFTQLWDFNSDTVTGNITLYAKWTPITYTVHYDKNAGDATGSTADSSHTYDLAQPLTDNGYTYENHIFLKWNTMPNGTGTDYGNGERVINLSATAGTPITLYAQWRFVSNEIIVLFESNGGSPVSPVLGVNKGDTINKPAEPTKTGNTFVGWFKEAGLTNEWKFNTDTVTESITLYAKWTPIRYTVRYDKNAGDAEGESIADSSHTYDVEKTLTPNVYTRAGYTFVGWNTASGGGGTPYSNSQSVKNLSATDGAEVTLYAQWKNNAYTVTYVPDGGSPVPANRPADYGSTISQPAPMTKNNYRFDGWYTDSEKTISAVFPITVTGNITLYAKWIPGMYTVRYDKNASDATGSTADSNHTYDVEKALTSNGYFREGYDFTGWNTAPAGNGTPYSNSQSVKNLSATDGAVFTLYAQWKIKTYTVTYISDGGLPVPSPNPATVNYGTVINQPAAITKTGYIFDKWYTDSAKTTPAVFPVTVTGNIELYAKWTPITYTVRYDKNNGDATGSTADSIHSYGVYQSLTSNGYTRTGYIFTGWYIVSNGNVTNFKDGDSIINLRTTPGTVTLYAQWTINASTLTITYAAGGGTGLDPASPTSAVYGTSVTMPANTYTRTGYTFAGWEVSGTGSIPGTHAAGANVAVTALSTAITSGNASITLTATWTQNVYTVTFNSNGGTPVPSSKTVPHGETIKEPERPSYSGYEFVGWFKPDGIKWNFDKDTVTNNITLSAMWNGPEGRKLF